MQTVALKPKRAEWTAMIVGLLILCVLMLAAPVLCVPLALLCPLLACPLVGQKSEPAAWLSALVPVAASLLAGYERLYSFSTMLPILLPMLVTRFVPMRKRPGAKGMLLYLFSVAYALGCVAAMATRALGGPLHLTLAKAFVEWVASLDKADVILRSCAASGLIAIPDGYTSQTVLSHMMLRPHIQQMLMSLRLTMENLIRQLLPSLFVQASVLVGLFTALRLDRVHGVMLVVETKSPSEKQTRVVAPPSFRLLTMPRGMRSVLIALALTAFVLLLSGSDVAIMVGQLCFATVQTMFYLLGASVLVFMYTRNDPDRRMFSGVIAAALYVMAPFILLMIGIADQAFHFRTPQAQKPD
ncbi:MAG: hypothetical protein IKK75_11200 [Clostridia bacterium]|nr:hypothetical protein [Clostridia bacterium]